MEDEDEAKIQRFSIYHIATVGEWIKTKSSRYDNDIREENDIGEFAKRSIEKNFNTVRLPRYNNHIGYVSNINAHFKLYRCSSCDSFIIRAGNLENHSTTFKE